MLVPPSLNATSCAGGPHLRNNSSLFEPTQLLIELSRVVQAVVAMRISIRAMLRLNMLALPLLRDTFLLDRASHQTR